MNEMMFVQTSQPKRFAVDVVSSVATGEGATSYTTRIDTASTTGITYVGKAVPGSATSNPVWQIQRIDETQTPETTIILWADGNADFDNTWNNRTSLTYA